MTKDIKITPYLKAADIASNKLDLTEFEKDYMIWRMTEDIISGQLNLRDSDSGKILTISELIINGSVEINDLNKWLESNDYKFNLDPSLMSKEDTPDTSNNISSPPSVPKVKIAETFQDLHYSYEKWKKYLATPPDWLKPCRASKGSRGRSGGALWDPVQIGLCLLDKNIPIKTLDFAFHSHLNSWASIWKEKTALFRD